MIPGPAAVQRDAGGVGTKGFFFAPLLLLLAGAFPTSWATSLKATSSWRSTRTSPHYLLRSKEREDHHHTEGSGVQKPDNIVNVQRINENMAVSRGRDGTADDGDDDGNEDPARELSRLGQEMSQGGEESAETRSSSSLCRAPPPRHGGSNATTTPPGGDWSYWTWGIHEQQSLAQGVKRAEDFVGRFSEDKEHRVLNTLSFFAELATTSPRTEASVAAWAQTKAEEIARSFEQQALDRMRKGNFGIVLGLRHDLLEVLQLLTYQKNLGMKVDEGPSGLLAAARASFAQCRSCRRLDRDTLDSMETRELTDAVLGAYVVDEARFRFGEGAFPASDNLLSRAFFTAKKRLFRKEEVRPGEEGEEDQHHHRPREKKDLAPPSSEGTPTTRKVSEGKQEKDPKSGARRGLRGALAHLAADVGSSSGPGEEKKEPSGPRSLSPAQELLKNSSSSSPLSNTSSSSLDPLKGEEGGGRLKNHSSSSSSWKTVGRDLAAGLATPKKEPKWMKDFKDKAFLATHLVFVAAGFDRYLLRPEEDESIAEILGWLRQEWPAMLKLNDTELIGETVAAFRSANCSPRPGFKEDELVLVGSKLLLEEQRADGNWGSAERDQRVALRLGQRGLAYDSLHRAWTALAALRPRKFLDDEDPYAKHLRSALRGH